jgi:6-phosphofructokinase 1
MAAYVRCAEGENYHCDVKGMDVTLIANAIKKVPREFINEDENGITDKCVEYLMPLIAGECEIPYKNGIPCHFEF